LFGDFFPVECRKMTDLFYDQTIVERKQFEADNTGNMQARGAMVYNLGVSGPWIVTLGGYHRKESVAVMIESFFADDQGGASLVLLSLGKGEGNDHNVP